MKKYNLYAMLFMLIWSIILLLTACNQTETNRAPKPIIIPTQTTLFIAMTQPATLTPVVPTPTEVMSATSLPSHTPQETPIQVATQITPFVTGPSEGLWFWSPDSRW